MAKTKSIKDVIGGMDYDTLLGVAEKARKRKRTKLTPKPIGHFLAINLYDKDFNWYETVFVDNVTICKSYTSIHFNKAYMEVLPYDIESIDVDFNTVTVYYKNGLYIEIIRIS